MRWNFPPKSVTPSPLSLFQPGEPFAFIAKPTPQLASTLAELRETLPATVFEELVREVRRVYQLYSDRLREMAPGVARGRELHRLLNRTMEQAAPKNISCRRGCAACCRYEVEITWDEAEVLKEAVLGGVAIDETRLSALAQRERKSPLWSNLGDPESRCVFLGEDGACRVYEHRPAICRKHLVTSPPAACGTPGEPIAIVRILFAEVVLSAALGIDAVACGSLSKMLWAALKSG